SAAELGLEEKSLGIMELPSDAPVGEDFSAYLNLDDRTIELDLTPDRSDCLSIVGVAREVGSINRIPAKPIPLNSISAQSNECYKVNVLTPKECPRYACRIIRNLNPKATTPIWMRERLRRSGIRTINPIVDVTNYVLLELGQPMHSFDLTKLKMHIEVRMAKPKENLALLDGRNISLQQDTLVIADATQPIALAGIMGGEYSSVSFATEDILLESAFFTPQAISGRSRTYGLATDSSHRFERGVAPNLQVKAIERATRL
ncbi:phenylalanyl-tRNA synthetase, partial [Achromatium sp. WMS1]